MKENLERTNTFSIRRIIREKKQHTNIYMRGCVSVYIESENNWCVFHLELKTFVENTMIEIFLSLMLLRGNADEKIYITKSSTHTCTDDVEAGKKCWKSGFSCVSHCSFSTPQCIHMCTFSLRQNTLESCFICFMFEAARSCATEICVTRFSKKSNAMQTKRWYLLRGTYVVF